MPRPPVDAPVRCASAVLVVATMLGLALRLYQLTRPGFLFGVTEYDDGVYFGSAVRLVDGVVPYRDFVLVQPPGIVWLMAPLALLAKATGTAVAFAAARILTAVAAAAGVALTGMLVRRRGPLATASACGILAVYPAGINAAHTVLLEAWVVLLCLLGALAVFEGGDLTTRPRRLGWGGAAFGFAAAVKLWAVIPALVVLALLLCRRRRDGRPYLGGAVGAFGLALAPFIALAPRAVFHDVLVAQFSRVDVTRLSEWNRLTSLTGLSPYAPVSHGIVLAVSVAIGGFVAASAVVVSRRSRRGPPALERFALFTAVLVLAAFLWPPDYYLHYGWFFAPFLALSVALPLTRLEGHRRAGKQRSRPSAPVLLALGTVAVVMTVVQVGQLARLRGDDVAASARRQIPSGACVLTDLASLTIVSDRFISGVPGCTVMVDAIGTDYAVADGRNGVTGAGHAPALRALWLAAFTHADYVWLACAPTAGPGCMTTRRLPWTSSIQAYFGHHFVPVRARGAPAHLFVRVRTRLGVRDRRKTSVRV
jgi:hypothetical protein